MLSLFCSSGVRFNWLLLAERGRPAIAKSNFSIKPTADAAAYFRGCAPMIEGWLDDEYFVLFDASEIVAASSRYYVERWIPSHQVVGLRGWEDLLVKDNDGQVFSASCVPLSPENVAPFSMPSLPYTLSQDSRLVGKIKWYVKPLVFGGDPVDEANISWVSHEQHGQLVAWWNELYSQLRAQSVGAQLINQADR
jgi:hypothetical protein